MSLKFGDFVLDPGARQLRRGGEECHLGPKAFELLQLLLKHRPNVVAKQTIQALQSRSKIVQAAADRLSTEFGAKREPSP